MSANEDDFSLHPLGEREEDFDRYPPPQELDTFGGVIEVGWEEDAGVSMHGGLAFFIEFLKVSGVWEKFVEERPLKYVSPNAPSKSEILGTILLSVLSGHRRYAHITGIAGTMCCRSCWASGSCAARTACGGPLRSRTKKR